MSKDDRVIHEGQVLLTVKVRRVVKTAEYENYEVVLDEVHLARETDIKNTRERLIDAMTETIHGRVKAFEERLVKEYKEKLAAERAEQSTRRLKTGLCPECGCNFPMNELVGGVVGPRPITSPCGNCGWVPPPELFMPEEPEPEEDMEGFPLDAEDIALRDKATEHAMHPKPDGGFKGLELDPKTESPDELDGDLADAGEHPHPKRDSERKEGDQ